MFNAMEVDYSDSIVEAITQYAERATSGESKISEMESDFSQLKLAIQKTHAAYVSPQQQYFQAPPTQIQISTHPGPGM